MTVRYLVDTDGTIHDVNGHPGIVARLDALKEQGLALSVVSLADFDLLVGATALQHDLTLLTNSRRHFEFVEGVATGVPTSIGAGPSRDDVHRRNRGLRE
jgi:hypothetical protein